MTTFRLPLDIGYIVLHRPGDKRAAAARAARRFLLWPIRVIAARRIAVDLARMSDRELCDIGLSRQDLRDARALPLDGDPSALFTRRARERARRMR